MATRMRHLVKCFMYRGGRLLGRHLQFLFISSTMEETLYGFEEPDHIGGGFYNPRLY